jgi:hypothetical protein
MKVTAVNYCKKKAYGEWLFQAWEVANIHELSRLSVLASGGTKT